MVRPPAVMFTLTAWVPSFGDMAAQEPPTGEIAVGPDHSLRLEAISGPVTEPYLVADQWNPSHLIGAAIAVKTPDLSERSCLVFTTFNGGATWGVHEFPVKDCSDPYAATLPDGSVLVSMLNDSGKNVGFLVFRSADGGRTWSEQPLVMPGNHDHGTLVVDLTHGPRTGSTYAVSQGTALDVSGQPRPATLVARSLDYGKTFADPTPVMLSDLWMTAMNPVVLSDGTLVVPFSTFGRTMADGGFEWLRSELDWMVTSNDGARTFSIPLFVSDACGRTFPVLATDASGGPYHDRLYWVCNDRDFRHIYLHYSSDRGKSWSEPVPVNHGSGHDPYVRTPTVAINGNGVIGVSWYDGRDDSGDAAYRCQELFFSASLDGGQTFLPEVKVSSAKSCPATSGNGQAGRRWPAGRDYHGLAATSDGRFHVLWADSRSGVYELRSATIDVSGVVRH